MAVHKLNIEDFEENDYYVIAIHSSLEDYRLAYYLNRELGISLSKNKFDIGTQIKKVKTSFTRFTFDDEQKLVLWDLVENKKVVETNEIDSNIDLFSNTKSSFSTTTYLLPEYKKVDFFIKIENAESEIDLDKVISKISKIEAIKLVYSLAKENIKSKNNLIF
jgi:hypothetical protein